MEQVPRGVYTQEFCEQAVELVEVEGLLSREAAWRLSIPPGSLKNWLHAARAGKLKEVGKAHEPLTDLELELARTRKERAEVKQERDLLKSLRPISRRSRGERRPK
jgi:transposase-like protein